MKTLVISFFIFTFFINAFPQSSTEWKWIHPRPQGQDLKWVKMIDANNWYAVGNYGSFLKTTNAGLNWTTKTAGYQSSLYPGAGIMQNNLTAYFLNVNTGFIGVQAVQGIAKTTNGGQTFDTVRILSSGNGTVRGFSFINNNTGYLCGSLNFKVMKTTDAGNNWALVNNIGSIGSLDFYAVYASDENNIKVGSTSGNVYLTTNAGLNWTSSYVGAASQITGMVFLNANTGYVCGQSFGLVRYTTNGGVNWSGTNAPTSNMLSCIIYDGSAAYVSGTVTNGNIYKTTDNGTSWVTIPFGNAPTLTPFYAYSIDKIGNYMIAVGNFGEMLKSSNGGANWSTMSYRRSLATMSGDIYAQSGTGKIIACGTNIGANDDILISPDGGINWSTSNITEEGYTTSLSMVNPTTGYLSGRSGFIFKTTSGGYSWSSLMGNPVLGSYYLQSMDFVNVSTGWIVGGYPAPAAIVKIFKTTNGGVNWTEQPSSITNGAMGVKVEMADVNTGYMSYSIGLQKTTNSGANWNIIPIPPVTTTYRAMKVMDANTVYIGGANSEVYVTTNSGTSWDSLNFPVYAGGIFSTDWYDMQNGVVSAVIGVVGKTTNRGLTWQIMNNGGYTVYHTTMVNPDTMFSICGNAPGGMVMKYSKGVTSSGFTYEHKIPENFSLKQNYPNPFNPTTTIEFDLPKAGIVSLKIFDIAGREVASEINGLSLRAGNYKVNFDGSQLTSGVFFYKITTGDYSQTKKMILLK
ncbi:MAG: YCF48-related protein [Ignavibacteria bacterium]|nr:YCF48-related protein [Ignavibacteria bacterium]